MIATTKEQSARLIACGVDPKTADMCWCKVKSPCREGHTWLLATENYLKRRESDEFIPAWSLSALLPLLPTSLMSPFGTEYMLELSKLRMHDAWEIQWFNGRDRFRTYDKQKVFHKLWDKSPIEACVKAIEWLAQNGYQLANEVNFTSNKNEKE